MRVEVRDLVLSDPPLCEALKRPKYRWETHREQCEFKARYLHNGRNACGTHAGRPKTGFVQAVRGQMYLIEGEL